MVWNILPSVKSFMPPPLEETPVAYAGGGGNLPANTMAPSPLPCIPWHCVQKFVYKFLPSVKAAVSFANGLTNSLEAAS